MRSKLENLHILIMLGLVGLVNLPLFIVYLVRNRTP